MSEKLFTPQNKNAQGCVKMVMKYLLDITYKKWIINELKLILIDDTGKYGKISCMS